MIAPLLVAAVASSMLIGGATANCEAPGGECCKICRNGGAVLNAGHEFVMKDNTKPDFEGYTWKCGVLEETMADVNEGSTGAPGEARYCGLAKVWAEIGGCECSGESVDSPDAYNPNPSCNLCGDVDGETRLLDFVPDALQFELVDTKIAGQMPCGSLHSSLEDGVLLASLCPTMQRNAGDFCCNPPPFDPADLPSSGDGPEPVPEPVPEPPSPDSADADTPPTPEPVCRAMNESCVPYTTGRDDQQCCPGSWCRAKAIGGSWTCQRYPGSRGRIAGKEGRGGARGRARRGIAR